MITQHEVNKVLDTWDEPHCTQQEYEDSGVYGDSAQERANGIRFDREYGSEEAMLDVGET